MSAGTMGRGGWPILLTALVAEQPGKTTMELTRLVAPELTGRALERRRKAVHQALTRLIPGGGIGCSVSIEWVRYKRTLVCRWYPSGIELPVPVSARTLVLEAVRRIGRATPAAIHRRTKLAYSTLYKTCHQLAAEGLLVNVAPAPLQCWTTPDGDLSPWDIPPHYRQVPLQRAREALGKMPAPAPRKPREPKPAPQIPYITPIRARALGLTVGVQQT